MSAQHREKWLPNQPVSDSALSGLENPVMLVVSSAGIAVFIVHLLRLAEDLATLELEIMKA